MLTYTKLLALSKRFSVAKLRLCVRISRERAREGHLSVLRQWTEMLYLLLKNSLSPGLYLTCGLYRRDISWARKREYIGQGDFSRLLAAVNPPQHRILTTDKFLAAVLLRSFGVPVPEPYGHLNSRTGKTLAGEPLCSCSDLHELVCARAIREMCFKPRLGRGGKGFLKVSFTEVEGEMQVIIEPDGEKIDLDTFWKAHLTEKNTDGYLCESVVQQHPELSELNPTSLNTLRVRMARNADGSWSMIGAFLRMGVGLTAVDNISSGGICAPVDLASGRLGLGVDGRWEGLRFTHHPHTKLSLQGRKLPMWDEIEGVCQEACSVFTDHLGLLLFDMAFGTEGPVVVEVNVDPHLAIQRMLGQGVGQLMRQLAKDAANFWR